MSGGFFARLWQAFRVPYYWDRALQRAGAARFDEALAALDKVDAVGRYVVYKPVMTGHCHWQLGNRDIARECFARAHALLAFGHGISEPDRKYLERYISAHETPQPDVSRVGVSPVLLRWFAIRN